MRPRPARRRGLVPVWALGLVLALAAGGAAAQAYPEIREIAFEGNDVTRPEVMLREMCVRVGDIADPDRVECSRQGIQDLALFRRVEVRQEPAPGGVRLVFEVKEKFYLLPVPRVDASSDGGYAYGGQVLWSNAWGLNHSFSYVYTRRQESEGSNDPERRGVGTSSQIRYIARNLFDSPYNVGVNAGLTRTPYVEPFRYDEVNEFVYLNASRRLSPGSGSQGWFGGVTGGYREGEATGPDEAFVRHPGRALSLGMNLDFRDVRFNLYSDAGTSFGVDIDSAGRELGSDYHFTTWNAYYARYLPVGGTPHQTVHLLGRLGSRHGGAPGQQEAYSLGGVGTLRGFEPETSEGDAYWLASVEYLRPVFRDSIRILAVVDAGNAFDTPRDANLDRVLVSAGLGLRARVQAFVNIDLEIGVAWPLNGGSPRLFASRV